MARFKSDLENEIDIATENWIAITKKVDPVEWDAWTKWRTRELRVRSQPEGLTVPTPFPPVTVAAAKEYIEVVRKIRKMIGWTGSTSRLPSDPGAHMTREAAE
jgi:hypothetical protein